MYESSVSMNSQYSFQSPISGGASLPQVMPKSPRETEGTGMVMGMTGMGTVNFQKLWVLPFEAGGSIVLTDLQDREISWNWTVLKQKGILTGHNGALKGIFESDGSFLYLYNGARTPVIGDVQWQNNSLVCTCSQGPDLKYQVSLNPTGGWGPVMFKKLGASSMTTHKNGAASVKNTSMQWGGYQATVTGYFPPPALAVAFYFQEIREYFRLEMKKFTDLQGYS